jgi:hypothetical protein
MLDLKGTAVIAKLALVLVLLSYGLATLSPIYSDGPIYLQLMGGTTNWGEVRPFVYPQCPDSFNQSVPLILRPAALVMAALYNLVNSPVSFRLLGCMSFVLVLLLVGRMFLRSNYSYSRLGVSVFYLGLAIGTLPL